jgi:hypothetical protein
MDTSLPYPVAYCGSFHLLPSIFGYAILSMRAEWDGAGPSRRRRQAPDIGWFIQRLDDEPVDHIWRQFTH